MAPPGGQTVTKIFWLVVNSEILKGIKNMFGLFEYFHKSFAHVQANSVVALPSSDMSTVPVSCISLYFCVLQSVKLWGILSCFWICIWLEFQIGAIQFQLHFSICNKWSQICSLILPKFASKRNWLFWFWSVRSGQGFSWESILGVRNQLVRIKVLHTFTIYFILFEILITIFLEA